MRSFIILLLAACSFFGPSIGHPRKPMDMLTPEMLKDPRFNMMTPEMIGKIAPQIMPHAKIPTSRMPPARMPPARMPHPKMRPGKLPPPRMFPPKRIESPGGSAHDITYCGTEEPTPDFARQRLRIRDETPPAPSGPIIIDTHFHLVHSKDFAVADFTSWQKDQVEVLNHAYASLDVSFRLVNTSYTEHKLWSRGHDFSDLDMRSKLRRGDYAALNVYFLSEYVDKARRVIAKAKFPVCRNYTLEQPSNPFEKSEIFLLDGVKVEVDTMPGGDLIDGTISNHNLGVNAVHEVGHWMGLFHPFQGESCDADDADQGDHIDDTPPQMIPNFTCGPEEDYNSCPNKPGYDSIHNYMDYTPDTCRTEFTVGQKAFMRWNWFQFRDAAGQKTCHA